MSKTNYEEALDDTQILLALVDVKQLNAKKKLDMLNQIEQALEQAQKQVKLLELYKELNICYKKLIEHESLIYSLNTWQSSQIMDLETQIKELENK